ncbi:MAG: class I SAM-dependent methyltransferase [Phycisphaerae bacterium]|nr:class I SAM-dependent methyltransferase [Phycisphaerae bacterium]
MPRLTDKQDAYGHAMYDAHHGKGGYEFDERDDGFVGLVGVDVYFKEYTDWDPHERTAILLAKGNVLDIGCGAGRHAIHLQDQGLDVTGIDLSPLAIKVCKLRGLKKAKVLSITQISSKLGTFDTLVMFGNNFGLFGSFRRAKWLLRRMRGMTSDGARILAQSTDPYDVADRRHLAYHKRNRRRGRMSGQIRLRIRYRTYATPWFDYLLAAKKEMRRILDGTGWHVTRFIDSKGPRYIAVIEKDE